MNIVLFGYRGSGKSTVGRLVSERLGWSYFDTDDEVCELLNADTIADAWKTHGEAVFRQTECTVVNDLIRSDSQVISLGGGTLTQDKPRHAISRCSRCLGIYLMCDPEELYRRTTSDPKFSQTRPNRPELGGSVAHIQQMLAARDPFYHEVADHVIDVTTQTPEQTVDAVMRAVG